MSRFYLNKEPEQQNGHGSVLNRLKEKVTPITS